MQADTAKNRLDIDIEQAREEYEAMILNKYILPMVNVLTSNYAAEKSTILDKSPDEIYEIAVLKFEAEELALKLVETKSEVLRYMPSPARMFVEDDLEEQFKTLTDKSLTFPDRYALVSELEKTFHLVKSLPSIVLKGAKKDLNSIRDMVRSRLIFDKSFDNLGQLSHNISTYINQMQTQYKDIGLVFDSMKPRLPEADMEGFSDIKLYFKVPSRFLKDKFIYYEVQVNTLRTVVCQKQETPIFDAKKVCNQNINNILKKYKSNIKCEITDLEKCEGKLEKFFAYLRINKALDVSSFDEDEKFDLEWELVKLYNLNHKSREIFGRSEQILTNQEDVNILVQMVQEAYASSRVARKVSDYSLLA